MNKLLRIMIIASTLPMVACSGNQADEEQIKYSEDLEQFDLTRPARKITNYNLWYNDSLGVLSDSIEFEERFYFDSLGNQIKSELWNIPGQRFRIEAWIYDINGRKQYYSLDPEGSCGYTAKYFYDDNDKLIRKEIYASDDTLMNIETYKYDSNGNLSEQSVELKHMACHATIAYTQLYDYDDQGRVVRSRYYSESRTTDDCMFYHGDTVFHFRYGTDPRSGTFTIPLKKDWTLNVEKDEWNDGIIRVRQINRTIEYY